MSTELPSPPDDALPPSREIVDPPLRIGRRRRLHPNSVRHGRLGAIIHLAVHLGATGIGWLGHRLLGDPDQRSVADLIAIGLAVVALVSGFLQYHWAWITYQHASYRFDHSGLEIRRGVWWRHGIRVPRSRVQHTDISQGPLERRFGLARLVIHTAGTAHSRIELAGLSHPHARALRDHLLAADSPSSKVDLDGE